MPDGNGAAGARITVVFPLYRAAEAVPGLVAAVARQRPPADADPARWVEVIFMDDASGDDTVGRLRQELNATAAAVPVRVVENERNVGLARSLNRALGMVETDYVLTCHGDCRFGSEDYVARAADLLDRNPDVAVVSGQSIADVEAGLSRVEKVYLAANLMDVFPDGEEELVPVGFAEGRCDGFRMAALESAGFYDTTLRTAGEDQVLASRMRADGYRVCRAPGLRYFLSVSTAQDSLLKLVQHAQLFGASTPTSYSSTGGRCRGRLGRRPGATAPGAVRCGPSSSSVGPPAYGSLRPSPPGGPSPRPPSCSWEPRSRNRGCSVVMCATCASTTGISRRWRPSNPLWICPMPPGS